MSSSLDPLNFNDPMPVTHVKSFTHNPFQTNSYVCHSQSEAVIVDASCSNQSECSEIINYINSHDLTVKHLLLTHAHVDHILGCNQLSSHFNLSWKAHRDTSVWIQNAPTQAMMHGFTIQSIDLPTHWLNEQDVISFGDTQWRILETPGHAPGSICFVDDASQFVVVGDVLFHQSIGRTDLPGGDMGLLMQSIFQQLLTLPDLMTVYPGHGPSTQIGLERHQNPFLQ